MPNKVPEAELPILETLVSIRNRLSAIKRDKASYMRSKDIYPLWNEARDQLAKLKDIRGAEITPAIKRNRLDDLLEDVFMLLSLSFLSVGKCNETPAVYAQVVAMKQCFDQLTEAGVYSEEFLAPYVVRLDDFGRMIKADEEKDFLDDLTLRILNNRYTQCRSILDSLQKIIQDIDPELVPIREKLFRIRKDLAGIASQRKYTPADIYPYQKKLRHIDSKRVDGVFIKREDGSEVAGQAAVVSLLEKITAGTEDLIVAVENPNGTVEPLRQRLLEIRCHLERLQLTHKWTLRETDLFTHLMQLQEINRMRVDQRFVDEEGKPVEGQTVLILLLHKCSRMIVTLMGESVPVSEVLMPVFNQLNTLKQCLESVASCGAPCSRRELYPYSMKLSSIAESQENGIFKDAEGGIPQGQAMCSTLLSDCYDLLERLRANATDEE
ncbi:hypothetical protein INT43_002085 [Umbelopsis isabellina]|uniref:Uncharacterized protein n=1 Tax=Mortierella isabellina TaxID=91625 RepID=A0A8H7PT16_MORIS|nr:hypothetical protein INT43_002085 [Umbelopsis isabellina]